MGKKRKSDATRLDEIDRTIYTTFCSAANSLSELYSLSINHQRLSFQAGERHALERLYQWVSRQQQEGSRVTTVDIVAYLQNELDYAGERPMSPRLPLQHQHPQTGSQLTNSGAPVSSSTFIPATIGQGVRSGNPDLQAKNAVVSNPVSTSVRQSLQHHQLAQRGNASRSVEANHPRQQNSDSNSRSSYESMDMHSESPGHDFP